MSDVRALLKAKRQEARITHPYAIYNPSGQLKCSVCGSIVKHASAWEGHLGTKVHRTNIARLREEEEKHEKPEERLDTPGKRKAVGGQTVVQVKKRRRADTSSPEQQSFPQDFFSDPSHAPISLSQDSDEDAEDENNQGSQEQQAPLAQNSQVDLEYERFQRELLSNADANPYDRATVAAEPVLASTEIPGFPAVSVDAVPQEPAQVTEKDARLKQEQEERELIMDRLLAEERAQEDADMRVQLLKTKLDSLRSKREAAKANKMKHTSTVNQG